MDFFFKHRRQSTYTEGLLRFIGNRSQSGLRLSLAPESSRPDTFLQPPSSPVWFLVKSRLREIFSLDVRSLALLRMSLALVLLADLGARSVDLYAHYTDAGVLPRINAITEQFSFLSLHFLGGSFFTQSVLFAIAGLCAIGLLLGYRTRLMTVCSWMLLISLHSRNPMLVDGGDVLLRLLLFWSMFLPLGAAYSLDGVLKTTAPYRLPVRIFSVASIALLLQVCFVYWFTVALKHDPVWRTEGTGVYYALHLDSFVTPIGVWLRGFPTVLPVLSFATLAIEALGPCLLFVPFAQGPLRFATVILFLNLHLGFALCLALGVFPSIVCAAWLALLPTWFWHQIGLARDFSRAQKAALRQRLVILLGETSLQRLIARAYPPLWSPTIGAFFCVLCLGYIFLWNMRTVNFAKYSEILPVEFNGFGQMLRIDQMWGMFAPKPATDDGWYVIPARLRNGTEVDLFTNGAPVTWAKPQDVASTYRNQRWRKYLRNMWEREHATHRLYFSQHLCRTWNAEHHSQATLETFQIFYMKEETLPNGVIAAPEKVLLWNHRCF